MKQEQEENYANHSKRNGETIIQRTAPVGCDDDVLAAMTMLHVHTCIVAVHVHTFSIQHLLFHFSFCCSSFTLHLHHQCCSTCTSYFFLAPLLIREK
jgi:hypothetical protein